MRFRHLSPENLDTKIVKTDDKAVARVRLLQSREWQEHVADHHGKGQSKAQLVDVETTDNSDLLKKAATADRTTQEAKEEQTTAATHTVEHGQTGQASRGGSYVGNAPASAPGGTGDLYFGIGSARSRAVSGQCSCGMEITTGWQPDQTREQAQQTLTTGYTLPFTQTASQEQAAQPLYATGSTPIPAGGGQQQPSAYQTGRPTLTTPGADQRKRRVSAL